MMGVRDPIEEGGCGDCGGDLFIDYAYWSPARGYFTERTRCWCNPKPVDETGIESAHDARELRVVTTERG